MSLVSWLCGLCCWSVGLLVALQSSVLVWSVDELIDLCFEFDYVIKCDMGGSCRWLVGSFATFVSSVSLGRVCVFWATFDYDIMYDMGGDEVQR